MVKTKYIFITGGVLSGLGKGITAASVGNVLQARGLKVNLQKCDPYLNMDAGTLNPGEHGEVFVTEDGAETDMDLGHYERFLDRNLDLKSSLMAGFVFNNVLSAERKGEYLGRTIQILPHIVNEIQRLISEAGKGYDVHIVEIGGTVGDYEGLHFMEALRQFKRKIGSENILYLHVVFLPYLSTTGEVKTKPAQNSVITLRELGIQPDVIACRSDHPITFDLIHKISLYCDVEPQAIIPLPTAKTIYEVPLMFENYKAGDYIVKKLGLPKRKPNLRQWKNLVAKIKNKKKKITIGLVGKYLTNLDTYASIIEAVKVACWNSDLEGEICWIDSEKLEKRGDFSVLDKLKGVIVPGGFGERGIEGKILACKYARENKIPYLGLCLGMQTAVIEFARNVCGLTSANSTEFNPKTKYPVIYIMPGQRNIKQKGGTMRLGAYPCILDKDSLSYKAYDQEKISERHRHRYEFNNKYKNMFEKAGVRIAGVSPDKKLVEIIEIADHPFFLAVQFHPEFKSRPLEPHPLFREFIKACIKNQK
jgi:CTP synthase